jgi:hypothetical protein
MENKNLLFPSTLSNSDNNIQFFFYYDGLNPKTDELQNN